MDIDERGKKYVCSNCNTKFYDLNKIEVKCPKCGTLQVTKKETSKIRFSPDPSDIKEDSKNEQDLENLEEDISFEENVDLDDEDIIDVK